MRLHHARNQLARFVHVVRLEQTMATQSMWMKLGLTHNGLPI